MPKAPRGFVSGIRSEHDSEIHAESKFGNTHYFWLCQKCSCFNKHYKHMIFSNSSSTKSQYIDGLQEVWRNIRPYAHSAHIWMKTKTSVRFTFAKRSSMNSGLPFLIQCLGNDNRKPRTHLWRVYLYLSLLISQSQSSPTWILVLASAPEPGGRTPAIPPLPHGSHQIHCIPTEAAHR